MLHRTSRRNRTRILIAAGLSLSMTLGHSIVASAETPHTVHYNQVVAQAAPINPITIPGLPVQQIDPNSARHIGAGLPNFGQLGPILASFGGAAIFAMLASLFGRNKQSITANRGSQPRVQAPAAAPQPARSTQPAQPAQPRQSGNDATNAGHSRNNSGTSCASDSIVPNYGALATADAQAIVQETNRVRAELGLCPVVWDEDLAVGAKGWADHLVRMGGFEHPAHGNFGENLLVSNQYRRPNAQDALQKWMNSPGHRKNIVDTHITRIGVSIAKHEGNMPGGILYVQRFR